MTIIEAPKRSIESRYLHYPAKDRSSVPLLENGDHLTREEFEYRYERMPKVNKAELIEGVVCMPSPVYCAHGLAYSQIITWLGVDCAATPGVRLYDNTSVRLGADNEPQPDALLRRESGAEQPCADAKRSFSSILGFICFLTAISVLSLSAANRVNTCLAVCSYGLNHDLNVFWRSVGGKCTAGGQNKAA